MKIKPDQFYKQWLRLGTASAMVSFFERQVFDFTTFAGDLTKHRFKESFRQGGFYGTGMKWPARASKWGQKFDHPVMVDTGLLQSNIDGGINYGNKDKKPAPGQKAVYKKGHSYTINANPASVAIQGKRGVRKDGPTTYAAVHNTDPRISGYYTNQWHKSRPEHRQFMGLNKKIDAEITKLYPYIFNGLPGVGNPYSP